MNIHKDMREMKRDDVPAYKVLLNYISENCGTIKLTCKFIGISDHAYRKLARDSEIKIYVAQRILSAYEKIKGVKNV